MTISKSGLIFHSYSPNEAFSMSLSWVFNSLIWQQKLTWINFSTSRNKSAGTIWKIRAGQGNESNGLNLLCFGQEVSWTYYKQVHEKGHVLNLMISQNKWGQTFLG